MKQLSQFINEKLHPSKYDKEKQRPEWSIEFANDGDIVQWNDSELYFIYKCLNKNRKYKETDEDTIVYHVACNLEQKKLYLGPDTGVGDINKPKLFKLANEEQIKNIFEFLKENGYKWDDNKKELIEL